MSPYHITIAKNQIQRYKCFPIHLWYDRPNCISRKTPLVLGLKFHSSGMSCSLSWHHNTRNIFGNLWQFSLETLRCCHINGTFIFSAKFPRFWDSDKKNRQKRSKKKFQTSEKIFDFSRCEWTFKRTNTLRLNEYDLRSFRLQPVLNTQCCIKLFKLFLRK